MVRTTAAVWRHEHASTGRGAGVLSDAQEVQVTTTDTPLWGTARPVLVVVRGDSGRAYLLLGIKRVWCPW